MTVTVRGGAAVPLSLGLQLDLPPEVREANERRVNRQYEPFGGYRLASGLYLDLRVVGGRAQWDMFLRSDSRIEVYGAGPSLALSWFTGTWSAAIGVDYVFLEGLENFEDPRFAEIFLDITGHIETGSRVRPFLGARGMYNYLSFKRPLDPFDTTDVTSGEFGLGGNGGIGVRLSQSAALKLGASFSWVPRRDFDAGTIDDWQFISLFATAALQIASQSR